jgi:UDP-glucose 4-epimerase
MSSPPPKARMARAGEKALPGTSGALGPAGDGASWVFNVGFRCRANRAARDVLKTLAAVIGQAKQPTGKDGQDSERASHRALWNGVARVHARELCPESGLLHVALYDPDMNVLNVLVTGGTGYIGSHAVQRLLRDGHRVVALDNLFRGHKEVVSLLTPGAQGRLMFVEGDITDRPLMARVMVQHDIDTVMHFAALAYVGESVDQPTRYYHNNVAGLISTLEACEASQLQGRGVSRFVFSSSCATYGQPPEGFIPVPETCPQSPVSPYGWTKLHGEHILRDFGVARAKLGVPFGYAMLRYFNVCGCDHSGLLGEDHDPESHLIPVILQAAMGQRSEVGIFGTDYLTPDGTCVRDYVHVEDLIDAHVLAMGKLRPGDGLAYNVGIGKGYSVREIINAVKKVTGKDFAVNEKPRRPGDPPMLFNNPARIRAELGWSAKHTDLHEIIASAWRWFQKHPRGYKS